MRPKKYTDEQLFLDYLNASNKAGKWLRSHEIGPKTGLAYYKTYSKRFGKITNIRKLIVEKFSDSLKFPANIKIRWENETDEEILKAIIAQSILAGYKLRDSDIGRNKYLPSPGFVLSRIGYIEHIHLLASKMSEDFAKLPHYTEAQNSSVVNRYIKNCLEQNQIIPIFKLNSSDIGFSYRYIYRHFGSFKNFKLKCAKASPEFAELLARHNQNSR